jgi:hypothetical protein
MKIQPFHFLLKTGTKKGTAGKPAAPLLFSCTYYSALNLFCQYERPDKND